MTFTRFAWSLWVCLAAIGGAWAQSSPYAGEQTRAIKSLSDKELDDLRMGRGMGLAKAAELNGYPGPAHVLELAQPLHLSAQQREATQSLMAQHKATAQTLGAKVVDAERALDDAFASHRIDEPTLAALTATVSRLQGELRAEHLRTHLAQTALLTPEQIQHYAQIRGYSQRDAMPPGEHQHH